MKKTKKLMVMSILAISAFILCGIANVKAAAFSLKNQNIVCDPQELEKGGRAECYIIGVPDSLEANASVNGYIVNAYTTKYLKLVSAKEIVANTKAAWTDATSATGHIASTGDMPTELTSFSCPYDSQNIDNSVEPTSYGCGVFYTITTAPANAFTKDTVKNTGIKSGILPNATYGVIGSLVVELDQAADGNECGEICVRAWRVPEKANYANYNECGNGESNPNNCGAEGPYKCKEIHYDEHQTTDLPSTGAFASYAILAACALIAVSAIALSKKNNKFSKI